MKTRLPKELGGINGIICAYSWNIFSVSLYIRISTYIFLDVPFYNLYECRVLPIQTNSVLSKNFKLDFLLCLLYIRSCLPSPNNIIQNNVPEQYTQHPYMIIERNIPFHMVRNNIL